MKRAHKFKASETEVEIPIESGCLRGTLTLPEDLHGLVLFAHGSGSSRKSPRNRFVADILNEHQLGTLLFDLLTPNEEKRDMLSGEHRFDIGLLAHRLVAGISWAREKLSSEIKLGLFGASTGAAAALVAAAECPNDISAVVSRGGRPDLAGPYLKRVFAPTLLLVGERDEEVIKLNEQALAQIPAEKRRIIVPKATHLFEEPGALEEVAEQATRWFNYFLHEQNEKGLLLDSI